MKPYIITWTTILETLSINFPENLLTKSYYTKSMRSWAWYLAREQAQQGHSEKFGPLSPVPASSR